MGLCYAALRPATSGAASSSTGGSSSATFAGDKKYRGMLYTCITKMLYLSMADPSSNRMPFPLSNPVLGGQGLGGEVPWTSPQETMTGERKDSGEYGGGGVGGSSMHDCRARSLTVLEPLAGDLADLLGTDAFAGPAIWRISALAALTALLTALRYTIMPTNQLNLNPPYHTPCQPILTLASCSPPSQSHSGPNSNRTRARTRVRRGFFLLPPRLRSSFARFGSSRSLGGGAGIRGSRGRPPSARCNINDKAGTDG